MSPEYLPPPKQHSSATGIPAAALAAAIMWILFGGFMLFSSVMLVAQGEVGLLQLLFGAPYVAIAIRVLCAKPAGLLGRGITSIVLGALFTLIPNIRSEFGAVALRTRATDHFLNWHVVPASPYALESVPGSILARPRVLAVRFATLIRAPFDQ